METFDLTEALAEDFTDFVTNPRNEGKHARISGRGKIDVNITLDFVYASEICFDNVELVELTILQSVPELSIVVKNSKIHKLQIFGQFKELTVAESRGDDILIQDSIAGGNLIFISARGFDRLVLRHVRLGQVLLDERSVIGSVIFEGVQSEDVNISCQNEAVTLTAGNNDLLNSWTTLQKLTIKLPPLYAGKLDFSFCDFRSFLLTGNIDTGATLLMQHVELGDVDLNQVYNLGSMKVSNITVRKGSQLSIRDCDLSNMNLFAISLAAFTGVSVWDSNISKVVTTDVEWCKNLADAKGILTTPRQKRELARQLKNITINQNDKPAELRFYALEMGFLRREMAQSKTSRPDRFILWFNSFTNQHGLNWIRALKRIFWTIGIGYFSVKMLLGYTRLDLSLHTILQNAAEIAECFNPVRKFSDSFGLSGKSTEELKALSNLSRTNGAKLIDIIFLRLCLGLLYFQMIKAFRKYVR